MDPFHIHCETCAARLKVRNASAIGQRLACPRCGNMVLVTTPEGWKSSESEVTPPEDAVDPTQACVGGFDDIAQILSNSPTPVPEKTTRKAQPAGSETKPGRPLESAPEQGGSVPILPDDQWTAPAVQQRRRWLLLSAAAATLVIVTIAVLLYRESNSVRQEIVDVDPVTTAKSTDPIASEPEETTDGQHAHTDIQSEPVESEPVKEEVPRESADPQTDPPSESDARTEDDTPATPVAPVPEIEDAARSGHSESESSQDNLNPAVKSQPSPFGTGIDELLKIPAGESGELQTNFGELSEALEDSGTSLFEINQIASMPRRPLVGTRKYFIKRPEPLNDRNLKRLGDPCQGVQYIDQLLTLALAEINQITGVPISFDAETLAHEQFDFNYRLEKLHLTDTDFRSVVESMIALQTAKSPDTEFVLDYDGNAPATITIANLPVIRSAIVAFPAARIEDQDWKEHFVELVRQVIEPASWNDANKTCSITIENEGFLIRHRHGVVADIRSLLDKWNQADAVRSGTLNATSLRSRWSQSQDARESGLEWTARPDLPIQLFLAEIQQQTGVTILIDWNTMLAAGWNPNTVIPFDLEEPTVGRLLNELVYSMDAGWRVINPTTFEITTREIIDSATCLELYYCGDILDGALDEEKLVQLVQQSLQSANRLTDEQTRVYFDSTIRSFVVAAPQAVQKQIEAILKRLSGM